MKIFWTKKVLKRFDEFRDLAPVTPFSGELPGVITGNRANCTFSAKDCNNHDRTTLECCQFVNDI